MFQKKPKTPVTCDPENCEHVKSRGQLDNMIHDQLYCKRIKIDTDIINGLLREIDALHLLLEKERKASGNSGDEGHDYISNCQSVNR